MRTSSIRKNFASHLYLACCHKKDSWQPAFQYVHFQNDYAYATDGNVLAKQALYYSGVIDKENLNGKKIHKDVFKNILKFDVATAKVDGIECYENATGATTFFKYDNGDHKAPNFEIVINDDYESVAFVGIDPKHIQIADKCLAREFDRDPSPLEFMFNGCNKPVHITAKNIQDQVFLITPTQIKTEWQKV